MRASLLAIAGEETGDRVLLRHWLGLKRWRCSHGLLLRSGLACWG